jgi:hypothetical protein
MKNLSNNELSELNCLMHEIKNLIERTYLHVSSENTKKILNTTKKEISLIEKEYDKRGL